MGQDGERDRDGREGKGQPVQGDIKTDGWKETQGEERAEGGGARGGGLRRKTTRNSPSVKSLHLDEIHIYNGASIPNPTGAETAHRNFRIMQHVEIFPELFEILNSLYTRWEMA